MPRDFTTAAAAKAGVCALVLAVALAACKKDRRPTAPDSIKSGVTSEKPGAMRVGYIRGRGGKPVKIMYHLRDGHAIFEGDIDLGLASDIPTSAQGVRSNPSPGGPSLAVSIDPQYRWKDGVVPYKIEDGIKYPTYITDAIAHIEAMVAGVDFVPYSDQTDFVRFVRPSDAGTCWSPIGQQHKDPTKLGDNCPKGTVLHEIGHALGLYHEHTRCNRDDYVVIEWANIQTEPSDQTGAFQIECELDVTTVDEYDEGSIMHYGSKDFSKNDLPTIRSKRGLDNLMGQWAALSPTDVATLRRLYPSKPLPVSATATALAVWVGEQPARVAVTVNDACYGGCTATVTWAPGAATTHPVPASSSGRPTAFTVEHVYPAVGKYPVSVEVTNQFGDRGSGGTPSTAPLRVALKATIVVNPPCPGCIRPQSQLDILVSGTSSVPATTLDFSTITLGDNRSTDEAKPRQCAEVADRTGDGVRDVICAFYKTEVNAALAKGEANFYLNGALKDGRPFLGRAPVSGL
jgi:hypothetical protein